MELEEVLKSFRDMNQSEEKVVWHDRYEKISKNFQSIERLDWQKVFMHDPEVLGSIINDILKLNVPSKGRPGKRPSLGEDQARELFSTLIGENFTIEPFHIAFKKLSSGTSIRKLSAALGYDKMLIHRLLSNKQTPSLEQMETIAAHYNKDASFFREWRVSYIVTCIDHLLIENPDASVTVFNKMKRK